ncbi:MAG: PilZ domain-containing protein [Candidatus Omnitrophota bacterium]
MVTERRRERRIKVRLPITMSPPDSAPINAYTENISLLGTYLEIEREIPLGTKLDMTIEVPPYSGNSSLTGSVRCGGDVFRCNLAREFESRKLYGHGIFFTGFSTGGDRNKLSKYVDFLIRKEQEDIKQAMQQWRKRRRSK